MNALWSTDPVDPQCCKWRDQSLLDSSGRVASSSPGRRNHPTPQTSVEGKCAFDGAGGIKISDNYPQYLTMWYNIVFNNYIAWIYTWYTIQYKSMMRITRPNIEISDPSDEQRWCRVLAPFDAAPEWRHPRSPASTWAQPVAISTISKRARVWTQELFIQSKEAQNYKI